MIQRLKQAIAHHEEKAVEINRQALLDLTDLNLDDLNREHHAVTMRLETELYLPEGIQLLQERADNLLLAIKRQRRKR